MIDSVVCGEQDFVWNGESLIEQMRKEDKNDH